jgi:adenine-specific DNA methylase
MKRLLIEQGLPFDDIDAASGPEKTAPPLGHPFKMHRWWARRPLAMSRAVVLGSLVPDPGDEREQRRIFGLISRGSRFKDIANRANVEPLVELLSEAFPERKPRVLDCFAGGGSIPLEALRLGCETTAIDLNPVAHLLERCVLEFPQQFRTPDSAETGTLASDVARWAEWVRIRAEEAVSPLYARSGDWRPLVWFWARTMACINPQVGYHVGSSGSDSTAWLSR